VPIRFLTVEEVLQIHSDLVNDYGGDPGIRDYSLLRSAVATPSVSFSGNLLHDGIPAMAGAYLFHLAKNHPFVDGNKRTALASAITFLFLNGHEFDATNDEAELITMDVAASYRSKEDVIAFFVKHTL